MGKAQMSRLFRLYARNLSTTTVYFMQSKETVRGLDKQPRTTQGCTCASSLQFLSLGGLLGAGNSNNLPVALHVCEQSVHHSPALRTCCAAHDNLPLRHNRMLVLPLHAERCRQMTSLLGAHDREAQKVHDGSEF